MVVFSVPWQQALDASDNYSPLGLARDVANLGCRLRQQRPWLFDTLAAPNVPPLGLAPVVSQFAWGRICSLFPPDPSVASSQPFVGGQCAGVQYRIDHIDPQRGNAGISSPVPAIVGPIQSLRVLYGPTGWQSGGTFFPLTYGVEGVAANGGFVQGTDTRILGPQRDVRSWYFRIRRVDGQPDNCGSRPPVYQIPPTPPSSQITINAPIFGQERTITISLPDFETGNWPSFEWRPIIEFDGIRAEFTTEGITIELPDNVVFNPPRNTNPVVENINQSVQTVNSTVNEISETTVNTSNDVRNIQEILNNGTEVNLEPVLQAIRCYAGGEGIEYGIEDIAGDTAGGVFNLPKNSVAVLVVGNPSANLRVRSQAGGGSSPDVYWWGSVAIGYGGLDGGTRIPLQYESQAVECGPGATTVVVSPYYELRCSVSVVVKRFNCDVDG